jgi:hypothetical protein
MMKRLRDALGWLLAAAFLAYGLVRLAVSGLLLAQDASVIQVPGLAEAVEGVDAFLLERADRQWVGLGMTGYLTYYAAMGFALTLGAIGAFLRRTWGLGLIGLYLLMHAGLFVNYQQLQPTLVHLIVAVVLFLALIRVRPPKRNSTSRS